MQCRVELDAVRGTMLIWIALTHLPTAASSWVNQPFGSPYSIFFPCTSSFLSLTAVAIPLARRIGWKPILWTSFGFWVLAQFGFRIMEHTFMMRYIPTRIPINEMGSFDLWAWQFLWFVGVWLGVRWAQQTLPIEIWAMRAVVPAVAIAVFCFILRRKLAHGFVLGGFEFLFDKWHLGPVRLFDFAAVSGLLILSQRVTKSAAIRPLVLLGQSSLQVFCVHLLFCFAGLTLLGNASMLNGWRQFSLLSVTLAGMLITAKVFSKSEAKTEHGKPAQLSTSNSTAVRQFPVRESAAAD